MPARSVAQIGTAYHSPMSRIPVIGRTFGAGLELAVRTWNSGSGGLPIVALHGITNSSAQWTATADALPGARRFIALDARGHGESDWDPAEAYAVDMHFADVATALDALGMERCLLAGFSMGGGVAILTAACLPERIAGVAVIDAYPHPEQSPGSAGIARWVADRAHLTRRFDPAISRHFRELLAEGMATRADLRGMWAAISCPALVVRGELSNVLTAGTADDMLHALPHARLQTLAGVKHDIPEKRPSELAALLAAFADELERRGA